MLIQQIKQRHSFFFSQCLVKEIEIFSPCFYCVTDWNTRESLVELQKLRVSAAFLVSPNFQSCSYNSIEKRKMFFISLYKTQRLLLLSQLGPFLRRLLVLQFLPTKQKKFTCFFSLPQSEVTHFKLSLIYLIVLANATKCQYLLLYCVLSFTVFRWHPTCNI